MTKRKHFIYLPGVWLGQGKISFNMSADELQFAMRWTVHKMKDNQITCVQEIEIRDAQEHMLNTFVFSEIKGNKFHLCLSNDVLGSVHGNGVIDDTVFAWEFRDAAHNFEGYEVFEMKEDNLFLTRAEYTSQDQMRTTIKGQIWPQSVKKGVS